MIESPPIWLPELVLFESYGGDWSTYVNAVYHYYKCDFIENRPYFENFPIFTRFHPPYENKGATFWHLISEGKVEEERTPDIRRCERIRWLRAIIDRANTDEIHSWETFRPWKNQTQRRINFCTPDFGYVVVIAERKEGFDLVTAFCVENSYRREKLKKEWRSSMLQKKEGSVV